jgi:hypothetical protein
MKRKLFFTIISICLGTLILLVTFFLIKRSGNLKTQPSVEVARIYQPLPTPGSDLQALETNAGIKIPANAREIYGMVSGYRDLVTYVRFDLPHADLSEFTQNTVCIEPLKKESPAKYSLRKTDPDWWQPDKASELQECTDQGNNLSQQILVDNSKPDKLTIYILSVTGSSNK